VTKPNYDACPCVVTEADLSSETAQSPGAQRISGISASVGATRVWMGKVRNGPGHRSMPHHHGAAETAGYVLTGRARVYYGPGYTSYVDVRAGEFIFVPPYMPHIEANLSDDAELVWLTARSPDNIVVNLDDVSVQP
jgi:uncharacterized RmlC-like cupin family protein